MRLNVDIRGGLGRFQSIINGTKGIIVIWDRSTTESPEMYKGIVFGTKKRRKILAFHDSCDKFLE